MTLPLEEGENRMDFSTRELEKAISLLSSTITNCEKMLHKFAEGTSQHSLLKNRIKALYISKELISGNQTTGYTSKELTDALPPIISIINKSTKAQSKYEIGSIQFNRLQHIIQAMIIARTYFENQING